MFASVTGVLNRESRPLLAHIVHRLAVGGLENGMINLINHLLEDSYRHAVICLTDYDDFRDRIWRKDVPVIALHKREGHDPGIYPRMFRVLRDLRPDIVHSRNLAGLEHQVFAALAGVPARIHSEHGRDFPELEGLNVKYNLWRRMTSPFVHRYVTVSNELANWLTETVGIPKHKVTRIYNGVDLDRFHPRIAVRPSLGLKGGIPRESLVIGMVGRMSSVKDPLNLVRAFTYLLQTKRDADKMLRLVMVGEGSLLSESRNLLRAAQCDHLAWLPGERKDIPDIMQSLDLFVLPSLREGISNTILEAMASGLAVVATRVGGNREVVEEDVTGMLVPAGEPIALGDAVWSYVMDRNRLARHGVAGRRRAESEFSLRAMTANYASVYEKMLKRRPVDAGREQ